MLLERLNSPSSGLRVVLSLLLFALLAAGAGQPEAVGALRRGSSTWHDFFPVERFQARAARAHGKMSERSPSTGLCEDGS